jgi:hypothetical protein
MQPESFTNLCYELDSLYFNPLEHLKIKNCLIGYFMERHRDIEATDNLIASLVIDDTTMRGIQARLTTHDSVGIEEKFTAITRKLDDARNQTASANTAHTQVSCTFRRARETTQHIGEVVQHVLEPFITDMLGFMGTTHTILSTVESTRVAAKTNIEEATGIAREIKESSETYLATMEHSVLPDLESLRASKFPSRHDDIETMGQDHCTRAAKSAIGAASTSVSSAENSLREATQAGHTVQQYMDTLEKETFPGVNNLLQIAADKKAEVHEPLDTILQSLEQLRSTVVTLNTTVATITKAWSRLTEIEKQQEVWTALKSATLQISAAQKRCTTALNAQGQVDSARRLTNEELSRVANALQIVGSVMRTHENCIEGSSPTL